MTSAPSPTSASAVLGNPLLLDKIVGFAIVNDKPSYPKIGLYKAETDVANACNLRLVQRSFLFSVHDVLYTRNLLSSEGEDKLTLIRLRLSSDASKTVEDFISVITHQDRVDPRIFPFHLDLEPTFFVPGNHQCLQELLQTCGEGLFSVWIHLCQSLHISPSFLPVPELQVPNLRRIWCTGFLHPCCCAPLPEQDFEAAASFEICGQSQVTFCQAIITTAEHLANFSMESELLDDEDFAPAALGTFKIPSSVTTLSLFLPPHTLQGDILKEWTLTNRHGLANLRRLDLWCYPYRPPEAGLAFQILAQCRYSLVELRLTGYRPIQPGEKGTGKLPVMEKLEEIDVDSCLDLNTSSHWSTKIPLPKLKRFRLSTKAASDLDLWTASLPASLESVSVEIYDSVETEDTIEQYVVTPIPAQLERIHFASPTLTHLEIFVYGADTAGLEFIFQEMGSLRRLEIVIDLCGRGEEYALPPPLDWDALFIGCPPEMAKRLREEYRKRGTVTQFVEQQDTPSIRNMSNLRSLSMKTRYPTHRDPTQDHFLSDVAFHLAFFKTANLKELILHAERNITQKMVMEWRVLRGGQVDL